jgi:hypothetical protein
MYKLIDSASFFQPDEITVQVLDTTNTDYLVKQAADSRIQDYVSSMVPDPNKFFLHINAMGASDYYSANRNGDFFPESNLLEYYKTFETSPAHVFRGHINKDPARAIGKVLLAIYNERMHRVELIAEVDRDLGADIERKLAAGETVSTSMACKTPYDVCSICNNKARTRQEYCEHLSSQLGRQLPDGRKVMAMNVAPLKFFDISIVIRPADVTSSVLMKVAEEDISSTIGSAEMAESDGITDDNDTEQAKYASIRKLSEFIKEIEGGNVVKADPNLANIMAQVHDPDIDSLDLVAGIPLQTVLSALADLGISPSLAFLAELIARRTLGEAGKGLGDVVDQLIKTVGANNIDMPKIEFPSSSESAVSLVKQAFLGSVPKSSLLPEWVEKRASGMGYAVLGAPDDSFLNQTESYPEFVHPNNQPLMPHEHGLVKGLLTIGGAALLAKWYISSEINKRMREQADSRVKILLTKNAFDNKMLATLTKASMQEATVIQPDHGIRQEGSSMLDAEKITRKMLSGTNTPLGKRVSALMKLRAAARKLLNKREEA